MSEKVTDEEINKLLAWASDPEQICKRCNGNGYFMETEQDYDGYLTNEGKLEQTPIFYDIQVPCQDCNGTGESGIEATK